MENINIILVDDEESFRSAIARRLEKRGIKNEQAGNGEECLALLETKKTDVVVTDVKMPGMNGVELLRHIKEKYPKTEVILLTGHASASDGVEGIKAGAFDYITKPMELEQLVGKIKQAYEKIQHAEDKEKEAEFRRKMEEQMIVTERLASLGTLATGVAHEINNPLAVIKEAAGWMSLILKKEEQANMPRKADFEKAVQKIETAVERARRITHQLLGFVQKNESAIAEVNLKKLLEESVQLINREAANKEVEIIREIDAGLSIWSDPYQLRQVLLNLLTNAVHATGSGGKITASAKRKGDGIELKVADTGEGIPKENLKKIFEPFFSTKSPGKGTGLGLFVTRGIIDKLRGSMDVESEVGKGTCFTIILPQVFEIKSDAEVAKEKHFSLFDKIKEKISGGSK